MDINATLIGQAITFAIFVWFTMKFVWPPMTEALSARQKTIADGLAAAEQGEAALAAAEKRIAQLLQDAKNQAREIVDNSEKRSAQIVEEAKNAATTESARIISAADIEIKQAFTRGEEELRKNLAALVVAAAGKLLSDAVDEKTQQALLARFVENI